MEQKSIFRKSALDRLSSPEQLDQLMQVTTSKGWLALLALCAIILAAIVWSVVGRLPTTVSGPGILIKSGGIFDVAVTGGGRILEINVQPGDFVEKGQVISRIEQLEMREQINQIKDQLIELRRERAEVTAFEDKALELENLTLDQRREQIERTTEVAQEQVRWLEKKIEAEKEALALGLIAPDLVQNTIQRLETTRGQIDNGETQLQELTVQRHASTNHKEQALFTLDQQIGEMERQLELQEFRRVEANKVISPYTGYIREIKTDEGALVSPGTPLLSMEKVDTPLQAIVFIAEGKKVRNGMKAQIAPTTVKREKYGFIQGRIAAVSPLPATEAGIMRILNNRLLVQQVMGQQAPFVVEVALEIDPRTTSGFRWSSPQGPPLSIDSGTMCEVRVVVRQERPIALVIPFLKSYLGV